MAATLGSQKRLPNGETASGFWGEMARLAGVALSGTNAMTIYSVIIRLRFLHRTLAVGVMPQADPILSGGHPRATFLMDFVVPLVIGFLVHKILRHIPLHI